MEFSSVVTERTTAASDAALAVLAMGCAVCLWFAGRADLWRANVWAVAFGLASLASVLGAVVHGLKLTPESQDFLWHPLFLALGLSVGLFVVGVADALWGRQTARRLLPVTIAVAIGFYALSVLVPGGFLLFAVLELSVMTFGAVAYGWLTFRWHALHYALVAVGMATSIIAALIQPWDSVSLTMIWEFDHNGVFHLVQMVALLLVTLGLRAGFRQHRGMSLQDPK
jgi:hypothetical protein